MPDSSANSPVAVPPAPRRSRLAWALIAGGCAAFAFIVVQENMRWGPRTPGVWWVTMLCIAGVMVAIPLGVARLRSENFREARRWVVRGVVAWFVWPLLSLLFLRAVFYVIRARSEQARWHAKQARRPFAEVPLAVAESDVPIPPTVDARAERWRQIAIKTGHARGPKGIAATGKPVSQEWHDFYFGVVRQSPRWMAAMAVMAGLALMTAIVARAQLRPVFDYWLDPPSSNHPIRAIVGPFTRPSTTPDPAFAADALPTAQLVFLLDNGDDIRIHGTQPSMWGGDISFAGNHGWTDIYFLDAIAPNGRTMHLGPFDLHHSFTAVWLSPTRLVIGQRGFGRAVSGPSAWLVPQTQPAPHIYYTAWHSVWHVDVADGAVIQHTEWLGESDLMVYGWWAQLLPAPHLPTSATAYGRR